MILEEIARQVLTVGPAYDPPKGGIAMTVYRYERLLFGTNGRFLVNSNSENSKLGNVWLLLRSLCSLFYMLCTDKRVRIVHVHTASRRSFPRSVLFTGLARLMGRKTVMHVHAGGFREYYHCHRASVHRHLMRCDTVVALSDVWKDFFCNEVGHPDVWIVNNLVPEPEPFVRPAVAAGEPVHALFLGLVHPSKGIFDVVEVIHRHEDYYRGRLVLHVAGNGQTQQMIDLINRYGLTDIVKWEGWVAGRRQVELLQQCSLFVLPSYLEGLPISILEAMSYGMAILASDVGGIPSIVHPDRNGMLIHARDLDGLHTSLAALTADPDLITRMGAESSRMVRDFYPDRVGQQLQDLYRHLLNTK